MYAYSIETSLVQIAYVFSHVVLFAYFMFPQIKSDV